MCLAKLIARTVADSGTGWKVYRVLPDGNLESLIFKASILVGEWMLAQEPGESCRAAKGPCFLVYEHGFHVFKTRALAEKEYRRARAVATTDGCLKTNWRPTIVKVEWRGYIAEDGGQIVARRVLVPESLVKGKNPRKLGVKTTKIKV